MEKRNFKARPEFTSALTNRELIFAAVGLVLHLWVLPKIMVMLIEAGTLDETTGNFCLYAFMTVYVLAFMGRFLRRDFDPLVDGLRIVVIEVIASYFAMMCFNLAVSSLLSLLGETDNPNNTAIADMLTDSNGTVFAMSVFLAPIVEEVLFRGGIFGFARRYNRILAYIAASVIFGLYHIWGYVTIDVRYLLFLIQYIPAGILLCRCYERSNTIWAPIAMHMLVNALSLKALEMAV